MKNILIALIVAGVLTSSVAASPTERATTLYSVWKAGLPAAAKRFTQADDNYWRQWWARGFSPAFAWKNTDPQQVHTLSRPLLKWEESADRWKERSRTLPGVAGAMANQWTLATRPNAELSDRASKA